MDKAYLIGEAERWIKNDIKEGPAMSWQNDDSSDISKLKEGIWLKILVGCLPTSMSQNPVFIAFLTKAL